MSASDIAERLKARHAYEAKHYPPPDDLWLQAAAEITRLRSLVDEAVEGLAAIWAREEMPPGTDPNQRMWLLEYQARLRLKARSLLDKLKEG